jgi:hypothetical protein
MDTKANLNNRKKINELAIQHNKLTTLVACLLNEIGSLKKELHFLKGGSSESISNNTNIKQTINNQQQQSYQHVQNNPNKFPNFNELRAEDILKQLSINTSSN